MARANRRQTLSYLIQRFDEVGIRPQTRSGQNFLVDLNLQACLVEAAELGPDDVVLEVGTGTGSLTALLAEKAAAVVTVEIDPQLHQMAAEELAGTERVTLLRADALQRKNRLSAEVLDAIEQRLGEAPGRRLKLAANLPYSVATPILTNLLALERPPELMVATIQKELADRVVARPGSKDYGALSIWVQSQSQAEILRVLPPDVFWPRPKVSSAFLRVRLDQALRGRIADRGFFHEFVRAVFLHRRKLLRSELLSASKHVGKGRHGLSKPQVDRVLADLGLGANARAEQLDVETMLKLSERVRAELGG